MRKRVRGVSLLELMVALLIVGILLGVGIPVFRRHLASETVQTEADKLLSALKRLHNGSLTAQVDPGNWLDVSIIPNDQVKSFDGQGKLPTKGGDINNGHFHGPAMHSMGPHGDSQNGSNSDASGTGLSFVLVSMRNGTPNSLGIVQMDPSVTVHLVNAIGPDATGTNATALFYPTLNASVIFQASGQLDPKHTGSVAIQIGNGPVTQGVVQGSKGIEIDVTQGGAISTHALPTVN